MFFKIYYQPHMKKLIMINHKYKISPVSTTSVKSPLSGVIPREHVIRLEFEVFNIVWLSIADTLKNSLLEKFYR